MHISAPTGISESVAIFSVWARVSPRRTPKKYSATSVVMASAVYGWPRKTAAPWNGIDRRLASVAPNVSVTGSSNSRITIGTGGAAPVCSAAECVAAISGTPM